MVELNKSQGFRNRLTNVNQNLHQQAIEDQQKNKEVQNTLQVASVGSVKNNKKVTREDLPERYREIWDNLLMPVDTNISLDSVILTPENQEKIRSFIKETEYREELIKYGLEPMNRILMYGASGTGKTFLSKALSNHLGYTMLYVDIAKALTDDSVAKNISEVFTLANYIKHCIIFFDECDAIAWNRDTSNGDTGTIRRATNSIFQYLDQMDTSNIFISCTNMLQRLDAAFERRFNLKMEFRRPSLDLDECIKHFLFPKFILKDDVSEEKRQIVKRRAKQNIKLSYYEIEELIKKAMKRSILNDTNIVKTSDIYDDFAFAMRIKLYFNTEDDSEEIFHNNNSYDPR
jgi:SpoVK/Ycf46/Vps4 family AAA+-type ATPase